MENLRFEVVIDYQERDGSTKKREKDRIDKKKEEQEQKDSDKNFRDFQKKTEKDRKENNKQMLIAAKKRDKITQNKQKIAAKQQAVKQKNINKVKGAAQKTPGVLSNPGGFLAGGLIGLTRFIPHAFIAFLAIEIFKMIRDSYFGAGGAGDVRLKILVKEQIQVFQKRQDRADLQLGKKVIRTTSLSGLRDKRGSIGGSLHDLQRGKTFFNDPDEFTTKGVP